MMNPWMKNYDSEFLRHLYPCRVMNTVPYNLNKKSENVPQQNTMGSIDALSIKQGQ